MTTFNVEPEDSPLREADQLGQVDTSFYLIGVGASAGGLEAIKTMVRQLPQEYPHSFVIVQHISPDYKSLMGELLSRETSLNVREVEDHMLIEPRHIYVIPPRWNIIIKGTDVLTPSNSVGKKRLRSTDVGLHFALLDKPPKPQLNLPVDLFFNSLATAVGDRAVAVVLSGTGSDGSRGLRTVKDAEGLVVVQDPKTAAFDGMPRAAVETQIADIVVPPDEIVSELRRYFDLRKAGLINVESLFSGQDEPLARVIRLAASSAKIDFSQYKPPTLKRRVARRMGLRKTGNVSEYADLLESDPVEAATLCREFLVGVTHFFRDLPAWQELAHTVLPQLFESYEGSGVLKIWSVGCSTGEEAFTIAMILEAWRIENHSTVDFRVFATDVNKTAIAVAKEGIYPQSAYEDIPPKYAHEFVSYNGDRVQISETIKNKVMFSVHNAVEDPPFIQTDLVVCRNMLIYLNHTVQAQLVSTFSYSLKPDRFLFLGVSESLERSGARFQSISERWRILRNISKSRAKTTRTTQELFEPIKRSALRLTRSRQDAHLQRELNATLLQSTLLDLDSCLVLVDNDIRVLETFGNYKKHLRLPDGSFSANLLDLVPEQLTSTLALLCSKAGRDTSAHTSQVQLPTSDGLRVVDIRCRAIEQERSEPLISVMLRDVYDSTIHGGNSEAKEALVAQPTSEVQAGYVVQLETELEATKEMLGTTVEDLGLSNQDLRTANEELMSTNEELQATNEEIQSVNEELHTVNAEHSEKISELQHAYEDIANLLNNTDMATVFLDERLRIRRFSESIKLHFHLDTQDIGRPLSHFSSSLVPEANQRLLSDAELALTNGSIKTYEVSSVDGSWYIARVRPYSSNMGVVNGVVLTFVDITQVKVMQGELELRRNLLEGLLESEIAGYWEKNLEKDSEYLSPRLQSMVGYDTEDPELVLKRWEEIAYPEDLPVADKALEEHIRSRGRRPYDIELRLRHRNGSCVWVWRRGKVVDWGPNGEALRLVGCHFDISQLKQRELDTVKRATEIRRFAFASAHDLREPMNTIESFVGLLKEEVGDSLEGEQLTMMKYITRASARMKSQIESVLEYAKLQDHALELETVDMEKRVEACLSDLSSRIREEGALITVEKLPKALGVPSLVGRVLQNLLSNAIKFRRPGHVPKISISSVHQNGGMVAYQVSDNGIGIPKEYRGKVFQVFTRLHTISEYEGTGLGLALCEKIVGLHKGEIWVEDGDEGGSRFVFSLKGAG